MTRTELIQRNSNLLNLFAFLFIVGFSYFLYCLYLERQILIDYLQDIPHERENYPILPMLPMLPI